MDEELLAQQEDYIQQLEELIGFHSAHFRGPHLPNYHYARSQYDPTKFIHNEQYFSKMAKINPDSFTVSGQKLKGQYMTAKQIAQANRQAKTRRQQGTGVGAMTPEERKERMQLIAHIASLQS